MPKAVKKPIEIEVEQFVGKAAGEAQITLDEDGIYKVFNTLHNSWIEVKVGDWLNVTNSGDVYPIDAEYFKNNYNLI